MNMRGSRRYAVVVLAAAIVVMTLIWLAFPQNRATEFPLATVSRTDMEIRVNSVGSLDAERAHMVSSNIKGDKGKIIYLVDDGTMVKGGDVLVRFDATPFEAEVLRLNGEVRSREAVVEASKQVLEWEKSQAEGAIKNIEFNVRDARQEFSQHAAYIKDLEALSKRGFNYPTEVAQARKKAEQLYAKQQKAETDLEQAQKEGAFKIAGGMAALSKAKSELETTKLSFEEAEGELQKTVINAPFQGIVVHYEIFRDNQKRKPKVGDTVWQNQPLLYLPDVSGMIVKTQVREVDLHKISAGQKAGVQVDAYPDITYEGEVTAIGVLATDSIEGVRGEKYFQLSVTVHSKDLRLRPGMTSRVSILVSRVSKCLSVPQQAVFEENGRKFCYVRAGRTFRKTEVTVGRQNEDFAEITAGLSDGERVSLIRPRQEEIL